jgi:hypothetical protein
MAALTRVARTAPVTLSHTFVVGETPADPSPATATVAIVDANGTTVVASTAATHGTAGVFTYALAGQAQLAHYTAAWTATFSGSAVVETDYVEVAGGFYFDLATARASDSSLADATKYPLAALITARQEAEDECEQICDRAFVPRYHRAVLDGSGTADLLLTDYAWAAEGRSAGDVRTIRTASVAPQVGQTFVALTSTQRAALYVTADGQLRRTDGNIWPEGVGNVIVEYEYGWDAPPSDLVRAALTRLRTRLNLNRSGVPDRASSFTATDGGTYRLDLPGAFKTGIPEVDAVYGRYSRRSGSGTGTNGRPIASSRTLTFDPQRNSIFHGGLR